MQFYFILNIKNGFVATGVFFSGGNGFNWQVVKVAYPCSRRSQRPHHQLPRAVFSDGWQCVRGANQLI